MRIIEKSLSIRYIWPIHCFTGWKLQLGVAFAVLGVLVAIVVLIVLRYRRWRRGQNAPNQENRKKNH